MRVCRIAVRNRPEDPILHSGLFARLSDGLLVSAGGGFNSKDAKIFQSAFDRCRRFADEGGRSPPETHREAHQRSKVDDEQIAFVFQI